VEDAAWELMKHLKRAKSNPAVESPRQLVFPDMNNTQKVTPRSNVSSFAGRTISRDIRALEALIRPHSGGKPSLLIGTPTIGTIHDSSSPSAAASNNLPLQSPTQQSPFATGRFASQQQS
jgi:hypothetical protein